MTDPAECLCEACRCPTACVEYALTLLIVTLSVATCLLFGFWLFDRKRPACPKKKGWECPNCHAYVYEFGKDSEADRLELDKLRKEFGTNPSACHPPRYSD